MKTFMTWVGILLLGTIFGIANPVSAQLKLGYVDSQIILGKYKEAQDAQQQLQDLNKRWQEEAQNMEKDLQAKQDALESQALLLSDERRKEKETEIQNLYIRFQQFQQEKWGAQGEVFTKRAELMQPVIDKINTVIKKIGSDEKFDYIFDVVNGNILHVSDGQPNLTDKVLEELNKGVATKPASTTQKN